MLVLMKGIFENHTLVVSSGDHYIRILTLVTRKTQVDCILINSSLPLSIFAGRTVQAGLILQLRGIRNRILTKAEHSILVVLVPVSKTVVVFHVPSRTGIKRQIHFNVLITIQIIRKCLMKVGIWQFLEESFSTTILSNQSLTGQGRTKIYVLLKSNWQE